MNEKNDIYVQWVFLCIYYVDWHLLNSVFVNLGGSHRGYIKVDLPKDRITQSSVLSWERSGKIASLQANPGVKINKFLLPTTDSVYSASPFPITLRQPCLIGNFTIVSMTSS